MKKALISAMFLISIIFFAVVCCNLSSIIRVLNLSIAVPLVLIVLFIAFIFVSERDKRHND